MSDTQLHADNDADLHIPADDTMQEDAADAPRIPITEVKKKSTLNTVFAVALGVIVIFVLVVLFYASKGLKEQTAATNTTTGTVAQPSNLPDSSTDASATGNTGEDGDTDSTAMGAIKVVEETSYNHYNAYLDSDQKAGYDTPGNTASSGRGTNWTTGGSTGGASGDDTTNNGATTAVDTSTDTVESSDSSPETAEPAPAPTPTFALADVVGLDEDDATAQAKKAGYTVTSVYVCDSKAVKGTGKRPKAGRVLQAKEYTLGGSDAGGKLAFLYVATSDPYSKAKKVPNVKGKAWKSARATLRAKGLGIRYLYEAGSTAKTGTVIYQAPASGSYQPRGSSVVVVLAD
ncbi:MAG: PASTA domain-containing protein [Actinomycetes bacterium]|jgi:cell division protein FtsN|nr:PASTA domain-containing protein [Actinomycetes bacterium]